MSKIEWTNETQNPFVGCTKVSQGCQNCYALPMAVRNAHNHKLPNEVREAYLSVITKVNDKWQWNGKTAFIESALYKPLSWRKPRMVFLVSMGDLFHENNSFTNINKVFNAIAFSPQHTFQILTKRPERMLQYFTEDHYNEQELVLQEIDGKPIEWPLKNLWLGVTAENQEQADKRIPILLQIPAAVKFVSIEPMLGNIKLDKGFDYGDEIAINYLTGEYWTSPRDEEGGKGPKLDWVICGGESGSKARPMHPDWVRSLRDQCKTANTPFFFKQWGEWVDSMHIESPYSTFGWVDKNEPAQIFESGGELNKELVFKVGKKKAGHLLDGEEYHQFPVVN